MFVLQYGVVCNEPTLTGTAVLGCYAHTSYLAEFVKFEQILLRTCSEKEYGFRSMLLQTMPKIEQGCYTYTTAHEEILAACSTGHRESMPQGQYAVEYIARFQSCKTAGAITHTSYQKP